MGEGRERQRRVALLWRLLKGEEHHEDSNHRNDRILDGSCRLGILGMVRGHVRRSRRVGDSGKEGLSHGQFAEDKGIHFDEHGHILNAAVIVIRHPERKVTVMTNDGGVS